MLVKKHNKEKSLMAIIEDVQKSVSTDGDQELDKDGNPIVKTEDTDPEVKDGDEDVTSEESDLANLSPIAVDDVAAGSKKTSKAAVPTAHAEEDETKDDEDEIKEEDDSDDRTSVVDDEENIDAQIGEDADSNDEDEIKEEDDSDDRTSVVDDEENIDAQIGEDADSNDEDEIKEEDDSDDRTSVVDDDENLDVVKGDAVQAEDKGDELDMSEDVKALTKSEKNLSEGFKAKAKTIFEAAVKTKIRSERAKLVEAYNAKLKISRKSYQKRLAEQVDSYLTYVVENWMANNKVAIDTSLRTQVAENFIASMKNVFAEHYIEMPAGSTKKVDAIAQKKITSLRAALKISESNRASLKESNVRLMRKSILAEASKGLALTQVAKLQELAKDIKYVDSANFKAKVATLKESYFSGKVASKAPAAVTTSGGKKSVIVEGVDENANLSVDMKQYVAAISRVEHANPNRQ